MTNHVAVCDLMAEADSYHRFWIDERDKRIALQKALTDLESALKCIRYNRDEWPSLAEARDKARAVLAAVSA